MKISELPSIGAVALWDMSTDHYVRWQVFNCFSTPLTVWREVRMRLIAVETALDKINENL